MAKKGDFQRWRQSWHTFFMVMRDTQCVLHSSHIRPGTFELDETNQTQWGPHKFKKNAPRLLFFFQNHPFGRYWPFWIFWKGPLKSSLSLIGSIGYPDMWGVQNNLSLSHNYGKSVSRLPLLWKSPFLPFWPFLCRLKHSWRLLLNPNVSDWFNQDQKAPWKHWVSPKTLK